ncbi:MAG: InlB B-repeat-containing protein [Lachnospiraceae bacterium]|nr:InlB B-repeat-containing protein [Lachnospiraceae bacterium]
MYDNEKKENISIKGIASDSVETSKSTDGSIIVEGSETLSVEKTSDDGKKYETIDFETNNQSVKISSEFDGEMNIKLDSDGDGNYDKDIPYTNSAPATDLSTCTMTVSQSAYTYTGKAITPTVTITDGANTLKDGTDYTVTYTDNINAGTATVTATGQGSYTDSLNTTFTINKASQKVKASIASSTIKYGGKSPIKASGIGQLTYTSDNTKVVKVDSKGGVTAGVPGKAVITIKAAGDENHKSAKTTLTITVKYAITYKLNGGTNAKSNPAFYDSTTATIKLANPTRTGYTFKGWYSDSKFKTKVTYIKKGSTGNRTLYAKWSANTYTIKFSGNGAKSGSMASKTSLKYGISYMLPANTFQAKIGYIFNGWNTKADGSGKSYANKASVKNLTSKNGGVVTLYAQWKKVKYTITYKLNGGTNAKGNPSSYYVTTLTIKLANPTRTGYTFKGWYADSSYRTKVTSITKGSTGNRRLYAKWSANTYTIKFNGNGAKSGSMASKASLKYGISYTLPANTFQAKIGYIFNGWNTKADGSGKSYANKASVKNLTSKNGGVVTLYAQWKKVKYTITYKLSGGTNAKGNPAFYYVTTTTIRLANPTQAGYTFKGWYADSSFKTKVTEIVKGSTGNRTLYAKWTKNPAVHIKNCMVILSKTVYTYDGTAKKPSVTVKDGNSTLVNGKDYTVTYVNNINAGTAAVTVTGKNRYTGSVKKSFSIKMPSKPVMVWNGKTASSFYYGTGTKENPYVIASAEELAYLAKTVNAGKKYTGKYFVLENDIILNKTDNFEAWSEEAPANEWTSIGICTGVGTGMGFNGTLDGQGHVIRGLYINTGNIYAGLFGYVLSEADISNLSLEDSYVSIYSGAKACMAGCLASYSQGMIYNCRLRGYCELRFSSIDELNHNGGAAAGGFVGYNEGTVFGCINGAEGKIVLKDGQYFCYEGGGGGIVGINERTVNSCRFTGTLEIEKINTAEALRADYIGGIVGDNNTAGAVVNCQNSGKMVIREELKSQRQDPLYPGGICGGNTGIVQNCCNLGPMSVIIQVANSSYSLYGNTGGIAACNYGYVENCFSTESASIQGYQSMEKGGIVGNNSSDGIAMNCYWKQSGFTAAGDNSGIITECKTFAQKDGKAVLSGTVLGTTDLTKALNAWITQRAGDSGFSRYRKWASGSNLPVFGSSVAKDNVYTAVKIPSDRCGDHITWSLKNGVLTLSGSGEMYNYSYGTTPWYNQKSSVKKVVIDNRITSIGNWAFLECRYLAQIRIPGSVKSIGTRAFQSCDSLREIEIPASVDMIYAEAFFDCENILKIVFRNASIEFGDSYMSDGDLGIENKSTCVLYGYKNSTVQEYAGKFGYKFKILE